MLTKHFPIATIFIIVLNGIIFAFGLLSGEQTHIIQNYGFIPNQIFNLQNEQQNALTSLLQPSEPQSSSLSLPSVPDSLTRLFASMFVHANIAHIAFNLVALAYLGVYAERAIGVPRYVLVYLTSGVVAALFHGAIASYILHNGNVALIGASGAISGVLGIARCNRQYEGILLVSSTNRICCNWFNKCTSNSIYCSRWWIYCWCGNDQSISKIRAVKKKVKIFPAALREKL